MELKGPEGCRRTSSRLGVWMQRYTLCDLVSVESACRQGGRFPERGWNHTEVMKNPVI